MRQLIHILLIGVFFVVSGNVRAQGEGAWYPNWGGRTPTEEEIREVYGPHESNVRRDRGYGQYEQDQQPENNQQRNSKYNWVPLEVFLQDYMDHGTPRRQARQDEPSIRQKSNDNQLPSDSDQSVRGRWHKKRHDWRNTHMLRRQPAQQAYPSQEPNGQTPLKEMGRHTITPQRSGNVADSKPRNEEGSYGEQTQTEESSSQEQVRRGSTDYERNSYQEGTRDNNSWKSQELPQPSGGEPIAPSAPSQEIGINSYGEQTSVKRKGSRGWGTKRPSWQSKHLGQKRDQGYQTSQQSEEGQSLSDLWKAAVGKGSTGYTSNSSEGEQKSGGLAKPSGGEPNVGTTPDQATENTSYGEQTQRDEDQSLSQIWNDQVRGGTTKSEENSYQEETDNISWKSEELPQPTGDEPSAPSQETGINSYGEQTRVKGKGSRGWGTKRPSWQSKHLGQKRDQSYQTSQQSEEGQSLSDLWKAAVGQGSTGYTSNSSEGEQKSGGLAKPSGGEPNVGTTPDQATENNSYGEQKSSQRDEEGLSQILKDQVLSESSEQPSGDEPIAPSAPSQETGINSYGEQTRVKGKGSRGWGTKRPSWQSKHLGQKRDQGYQTSQQSEEGQSLSDMWKAAVGQGSTGYTSNSSEGEQKSGGLAKPSGGEPNVGTTPDQATENNSYGEQTQRDEDQSPSQILNDQVRRGTTQSEGNSYQEETDNISWKSEELPQPSGVEPIAPSAPSQETEINSYGDQTSSEEISDSGSVPSRTRGWSTVRPNWRNKQSGQKQEQDLTSEQDSGTTGSSNIPPASGGLVKPSGGEPNENNYYGSDDDDDDDDLDSDSKNLIQVAYEKLSSVCDLASKLRTMGERVNTKGGFRSFIKEVSTSGAEKLKEMMEKSNFGIKDAFKLLVDGYKLLKFINPNFDLTEDLPKIIELLQPVLKEAPKLF